ncbi:MAG: GC-type dockerin domain-anchored protein [Phycisphaerales bacterium JB039]
MPSRTLALVLAAAATPAALAQSFTVIGPGGATDVNADGTVVVGNTNGAYETFRWTEATGIVTLGRATVPVLGVGAGTPGVSADGTRISATILDDTMTYATQGVWSEGSGWDVLDPFPPDAGLLDQSLGSAWDISGDGTTTVGLYWRPGAPGGTAHASAGTSAGVTDLGSSGGSSRASTVSHDGRVIGGFDSHPTMGVRRAAVWVDGVLTVLTPEEPGEVFGVSASGLVAVGQSYDAVAGRQVATVWRFDGAEWTGEQLGVLPGTSPAGRSAAIAVSADGSLIVGSNSFDFGPFASRTGMVWTASGGLQSAEDFLAAQGVTPDGVIIQTFTNVSADGSAIIGSGLPLVGFETLSFVVHLGDSGCYPDCDGSGELDLFDFLCFQNQFGLGDPAADCDGNGVLDLFDFLCFQNEFAAGCL